MIKSASSIKEKESPSVGTPSESRFSMTFDKQSTSVLREVFRDSEVMERKVTEEGDVDAQVFDMESKFLVR